MNAKRLGRYLRRLWIFLLFLPRLLHAEDARVSDLYRELLAQQNVLFETEKHATQILLPLMKLPSDSPEIREGLPRANETETTSRKRLAELREHVLKAKDQRDALIQSLSPAENIQLRQGIDLCGELVGRLMVDSKATEDRIHRLAEKAREHMAGVWDGQTSSLPSEQNWEMKKF